MSLWDVSIKDCIENIVYQALHNPRISANISLTEQMYKNINTILGSRAHEFWVIVRYRLESSLLTSALEKTY